MVILAARKWSNKTRSLVAKSGARLQPEGNEKFYWSGETFVITCQNNNNIKNGKYPALSRVRKEREAEIEIEADWEQRKQDTPH